MEIYTIGFTQTSAEHFFRRLKDADIQRLLDVRLNNASQLAGFAKARDLPFFLDQLVGARYEHEPLLAPTKDLLDEYKKNKGDWSVYKHQFLDLMKARQVEDQLSPESFDLRTVLLCSEATAEHCHRRLVCEYLGSTWGDVSAVHL